MKWCVILILFLGLKSFSIAQNSINEIKSVIDTNMVGSWPYLGNNPPALSGDGNYVVYVINNLPLHMYTFVIQKTRSSWKREFIEDYPPEDYFFTVDDKKLIWKKSDTLFFYSLDSETLDNITNVLSTQYPKYRKGEWISYQLKDSLNDLVIHNLVTNEKTIISHVTNYSMNDIGNGVLVNAVFQDIDTARNLLEYINLTDFKRTLIWSGLETDGINSFTFDNKGVQCAFMVTQKNENSLSNSIWYYKMGMNKAVPKVKNQSPGIKQDYLVSNRAVSFSKSGNWLFFDLEKKIETQRKQLSTATVVTWSYRDKALNYPIKNDYRRLTGVINVNSTEVNYIEKTDGDRLLTFSHQITGDQVVIISDIKMQRIKHSLVSSYWLINLKDGSRTLLKKDSKYPMSDFSFSPSGRWLIYWNCETQSYISYDIMKNTQYKITRNLPLLSKYNVTEIYSSPDAPIAGWYSNEAALLLYDRYDLWKVDPADRILPVNVTNGYGIKHHIKLRLVYEKGDNDSEYLDESSILLTGFNVNTKYNGFYKTNLSRKQDPILLTVGPYTYFRTVSQLPTYSYSFINELKPVQSGKGDNACWIVQRSSSEEYPNYFFSDNLKEFHQLTDLQPQKHYNWLTAEIITWKQLDGTLSQGVLYKPESFNPQKKYPVIFHYYEMMSQRLNEFPMPGFCTGDINIPWFVSRGYLVFTPDIHYSIANSRGGKTAGESALNSVVSAAQYLSKLSFVDSKKIAIQGHSFGGGETFYILTHSKFFAAACAVAATVSNEISAYLGFQRNIGHPVTQYRLSHAETGHDMIGATLWERPDLYIKASPVFKADKVKTPILIIHNPKDPATDWGQSGEMFTALRRLGKPAWFLQYENGDHAVWGKDAKDFTIRLTQFFDHYLKGMPAAKWMTKSASELIGDFDANYDFDTTGNCAIDCKVCQKWNLMNKGGKRQSKISAK